MVGLDPVAPRGSYMPHLGGVHEPPSARSLGISAEWPTHRGLLPLPSTAIPHPQPCVGHAQAPSGVKCYNGFPQSRIRNNCTRESTKNCTVPLIQSMKDWASETCLFSNLSIVSIPTVAIKTSCQELSLAFWRACFWISLLSWCLIWPKTSRNKFKSLRIFISEFLTSSSRWISKLLERDCLPPYLQFCSRLCSVLWPWSCSLLIRGIFLISF